LGTFADFWADAPPKPRRRRHAPRRASENRSTNVVSLTRFLPGGHCAKRPRRADN